MPGPVTGRTHNAGSDAQLHCRSDLGNSGSRRCAPLESAPLESAPLESAPLESAPLESLTYGTPEGHGFVVPLEIVERRIVVVQVDNFPASVGIRTTGP